MAGLSAVWGVVVHGRHDTAKYRVIPLRLWRNLWRARDSSASEAPRGQEVDHERLGHTHGGLPTERLPD
jgi:hypothetical protein